jgi:hypothetical protein
LTQSLTPLSEDISLVPLGAGDLIDRAIRLYRRHFLTLLWIAAPPVIVSAVGGVMSTIAWRNIALTSKGNALVLYVLLLVVGTLIAWAGILFQVIVMGGATRNLVTHLLWNEPVSARATYRNVRARFWGLLGAALVLAIWAIFGAFIAIIGFYIAVLIIVLASIAMIQILPSWIAMIIGVTVGIGLLLLTLTFFVFIVGRMAFVPQIMLVEGKGVFDAVGRSFSLAKASTRRMLALSIFSWLAAYSALMVLAVPLGIYAYLNGINPVMFNAIGTPTWYSVSYTVLWQLSSIIIAPVWMLGLSLLYVDQRVRLEGYDIELMAARRLGDIPSPSAVSDRVYTPAIVPQKGDVSYQVPEPVRTGTLGLL